MKHEIDCRVVIRKNNIPGKETETTGQKGKAATRRDRTNLEKEKGINLIWSDNRQHLATVNLARGNSVYGEKLVLKDGSEFRLWDPFRSKLAAAIIKGLNVKLLPRSKILYLGASTGTTVSHISDIVGNSGQIFAIESSSRVARELIFNVSSKRQNITPIIADARKPREYFSIFDIIDIVYCDIAQPDQTVIAVENCVVYLKAGGILLLVIKTRSIDVTMDPRKVVKQEIRKLEQNSFSILQTLCLNPFDKDHTMVHAIYNPKSSK